MFVTRPVAAAALAAGVMLFMGLAGAALAGAFVAPRGKVGLLAASSLRVEPYKQPFKVLAHD